MALAAKDQKMGGILDLRKKKVRYSEGEKLNLVNS